MMIIDNKYNVGDEVYLKTDTEQQKRIVTTIHVKPKDLAYELSLGEMYSYHYDFEITKEKNYANM